MPKRSRHRLPLRQFKCCKHRWGERVTDEKPQSMCITSAIKCEKRSQKGNRLVCANLNANAENSTPYNAVCVTLRSATIAGSRMSNHCQLQVASLFAGSGKSLAHLISTAAVDVAVQVTVPTLTEMHGPAKVHVAHKKRNWC